MYRSMSGPALLEAAARILERKALEEVCCLTEESGKIECFTTQVRVEAFNEAAATLRSLRAPITRQPLTMRLRRRPFLTRLYRHYRAYRLSPLRLGRFRSLREAWTLATI
jgi:hypothetical protein